MNKTAILNDGTEVHIRELTRKDVDASLQFFQHLPEEDRYFLRRDVTDRATARRRIEEMKSDNIIRIVATVGGAIVADGSLELQAEHWKEHLAEIRLIVAHDYQRRGLGRLMARELYFLAAAHNVEQVVVRFMKPQSGAQQIFTKLGFHEDAVLHDYVKDMGGHKQDLVIMRCNLEELWQRLESESSHSDWQRTR